MLRRFFAKIHFVQNFSLNLLRVEQVSLFKVGCRIQNITDATQETRVTLCVQPSSASSGNQGSFCIGLEGGRGSDCLHLGMIVDLIEQGFRNQDIG